MVPLLYNEMCMQGVGVVFEKSTVLILLDWSGMGHGDFLSQRVTTTPPPRITGRTSASDQNFFYLQV